MKNAKMALPVIIAVIMATFLLGTSPILAQTYIVQKGDSLFAVGQKYGISAGELKAANNLASDTIYPGQRLRIPLNSYTVKQGDTLFLIARKHSTTLGQLMVVNDISSSLIYPGQKLYIPGLKKNYTGGNWPGGAGPGSAKSRYVLGFYVDRENDHPSSYVQMTNNSSHLSAIAPFWYRLSPADGKLIQEHHTSNGLSAEEKRAVVEKARRENVQVLMLVHNLLYQEKVNGKDLARAMLATPESRKTFINQLETLIKTHGYQGVTMDVENIYMEDRDKFSLLLKELYQRFDPQGYKVTVCVPAKTGDSRSNAWSGPFDYQAAGRYSHHVAVMTYDEHGFSSGPGPIASYGWVSDVVKYAVKEIPPEKILLGIPGYGFDWQEGQRNPRYLSHSQAVDLAASHGTELAWDSVSQVPYFKYRDGRGRNHQVWFENASSLSHKLNIVDEYNLGGIALWRLGLEDPGMWSVLKSRVKVEKPAGGKS